MLVLLTKFNYGYRKLTSIFCGETVLVLKNDHTYKLVTFLGFTDRYHAMDSGAKPVKLQVYAYYPDGITGMVELKPGQHVQGALTAIGVYAVLDDNGMPRIV